ncbi:MAG: restriction endonuclease subunit S [Trichloromonadaceae bacterium]
MTAEPLFVLSAPWEVATLGDVCRRGGGTVQTGPFGSQLHASDYVPVGIPSIMPQNIGDNRISEEGIARITPDDAKRLSKYLVKTGDIVYSRRGDVERRSLIRDHENGWLCGTGCLRVSFGEKRVVCPSYAAYYLGHPLVREWIVRHAQGATMPNLNTSILSALPFVLPPFEEQERIAGILTDLDDKIELNRQINQTLEQIAQTIFKSWFVDFEPVKAKIEAKAAGRDPERAAMCAISGKLEPELDQLPPKQYQQLATTAALFPDELVESDLGLIPEGWEVQRLENMLDLSYGKSLTKTERKNGDFPVYGSGGITGFHSSSLVSGPGIIVGRKGTVGALYWEDRDFFAIDTVFYVEPKSAATLEVLFYLLQTLGLERMNTDAAVPGLNRNNVYRLLVPNYPQDLMKAFSRSVGAVREKIYCSLSEIETLSTLRDTLLPKLLSGELLLCEADVPISAAS